MSSSNRCRRSVSPSNRHDFIREGYDLARNELAPRIRSEAEAKYRRQLESASWFGRLRLRWIINREIRAELERLAPNDALYCSARRTTP